MESDAIIRDAGKVYSRLFDHRAIISPEIHQFIDEFETKPAKRENRNLNATLAIVTEMTQTQLPHAELLFDDGIPKLLGSLRVNIVVVVACGIVRAFVALNLNSDRGYGGMDVVALGRSGWISGG